MKLPFFVETQLNKILKPQIVTIVETFIDKKPSKKFYGKSLVANWLQNLYAQFNQNDANWLVSAAPFSSRTTGLRVDTGAATSVLTGFMRLDGAAGSTARGIVLGSAVVTPVPANYNVGTLIANGAGAGQLQYSVMSSIQGVTIAGQNSSFIAQRTFNNNSGGNVTVNAIALYADTVTGGIMYYLDAVSPADVIGNGQTYTVQITFQITT